MRDDDLNPGDWIIQPMPGVLRQGTSPFGDGDVVTYDHQYARCPVRLVEWTSSHLVVLHPGSKEPRILPREDYPCWVRASDVQVAIATAARLGGDDGISQYTEELWNQFPIMLPSKKGKTGSPLDGKKPVG